MRDKNQNFEIRAKKASTSPTPLFLLPELLLPQNLFQAVLACYKSTWIYQQMQYFTGRKATSILLSEFTIHPCAELLDVLCTLASHHSKCYIVISTLLSQFTRVQTSGCGFRSVLSAFLTVPGLTRYHTSTLESSWDALLAVKCVY